MAIYAIQNQWGGNDAPWHDRGIFVMGYLLAEKLIKIDVSSTDNGQTLNGII